MNIEGLGESHGRSADQQGMVPRLCRSLSPAARAARESRRSASVAAHGQGRAAEARQGRPQSAASRSSVARQNELSRLVLRLGHTPRRREGRGKRCRATCGTMTRCSRRAVEQLSGRSRHRPGRARVRPRLSRRAEEPGADRTAAAQRREHDGARRRRRRARRPGRLPARPSSSPAPSHR